MLGLKDKDINYTKEILSGVVIAIALVPEAIAFSFVLGVSPMVGLYSTVILALITSLFGGRPAMISAATGAVAAVFAPLVKDYGIEYLFIAVILMGFFQIIFGLINIGRLFRLISKPIMLGFVNGLAIVVLMAQLEQFKVPGTESWLSGIDMLLMISLTVFTFIMIMFIPKGIKLISVIDNINLDSATGRRLYNLQMSFAQMERKQISERTKAGYVGAFIQGKYPISNLLLGISRNNKVSLKRIKI